MYYTFLAQMLSGHQKTYFQTVWEEKYSKEKLII